MNNFTSEQINQIKNMMETEMIMDVVKTSTNDTTDNLTEVNEELGMETSSSTLQNVIGNNPTSYYNHYMKPHQQVRKNKKIGRNDQCPCGSGKKYKNCCMNIGEYEGYENA